MTDIRPAEQQDHDQIKAIYQSAFPPDERDVVTRIAIELLNAEPGNAIRSYVAIDHTTPIGHVAFSTVSEQANDKPLGYILAPLAVDAEHQKQGIGSQLVRKGIEELAEEGTDLFFVYGDPAYYSRFGFQVEAAKPYVPPHELQFPHGWQALTTGPRQKPPQQIPIMCIAALNDPTLW